MVGSPEGVSEQNRDRESNGSIAEAFFSPGTFSHVASLVIISGLLYSVMKIGIFGMDKIGSMIFLSLSISYVFSAIFIQTKLGHFLLMVKDDGNGIININYWKRSFKALFTIGTFTTLISFAIVNQIQLSSIVLFMGVLFTLMSFGQALSIISGGVNYYNSKREVEIESRTGMLATFYRISLVLLIFGPLIWLLEVGSQDSSTNLSFGIKIIVLIFLSLVVILLDKITEAIRVKDVFDGKILDRFLAIMIFTTCWHIFSALRRTPIFMDPSESAVIAEEGFLMSVSIILAVWSISNRGAKRGWKVFQSQSAIFWGISFGYAYAGSVASVSSLSEGKLDLISITAIGHVITAISIVIMIPFAIRTLKKIDVENEIKLDSGWDNNFENKKKIIIPDEKIGNFEHEKVSTLENDDPDDDVELID